MEKNEHYRKLENMYRFGNINREIYIGTEMSVEPERCRIEMPVLDKYFHAAGAIHGSVYFKMLDDAAYFAVASIVREVFIYTVSFQTEILRPVSSGVLSAEGKVAFKSPQLFIADAELYDGNGKPAARGSGHFMKSRIALSPGIGYR